MFNILQHKSITMQNVLKVFQHQCTTVQNVLRVFFFFFKCMRLHIMTNHLNFFKVLQKEWFIQQVSLGL